MIEPGVEEMAATGEAVQPASTSAIRQTDPLETMLASGGSDSIVLLKGLPAEANIAAQIAAFANSQDGGMIVMGVDPAFTPPRPCGLVDVNEVKRSVVQATVACAPEVHIELTTHKHRDLDVLVALVPPSDQRHYFRGRLLSGKILSADGSLLETERALKVALCLITDSRSLELLLEHHPLVSSVRSWPIIDNSLAETLSREGYNLLLIDPFANLSAATLLIDRVRSSAAIAICLYSTREQLRTLPGVSAEWRPRFGHYFKIASDNSRVSDLESALETSIPRFVIAAQQEAARRKLERISATIQASDVAEDTKAALAEATQAATAALQAQSEPMAGIDPKAFESIVWDTLREIQRSTRNAGRAALGITIVGLLVVLATVVISVVIQEWKLMTAGGLGLAGVIATLVTKPMRQVTSAGKQLITVQVSYMTFLLQIKMLNDRPGQMDIKDVFELLNKQRQHLVEILR